MLIHGGASGVGTAAIQLVSLAGAKSIVTAGSENKIATATSLGASKGFNYKEGDFSQKVLDATNGRTICITVLYRECVIISDLSLGYRKRSTCNILQNQ